MKRRICAGCDIVLVSAGERNPRRWCSERCRVAAYRRANLSKVRAKSRERSRQSRAVMRDDHSDIRVLDCIECGTLFTVPASSRRRLCSRRCRNRRNNLGAKMRNPERWKERRRSYVARNPGKFSWDLRRDAYQRRRAKKKNAELGPKFSWRDVVAEETRCGICGEAVDLELAWPDPMSPSLDHIVPLSKGGRHERSNVQLAHLSCNVKKRDRVA